MWVRGYVVSSILLSLLLVSCSGGGGSTPGTTTPPATGAAAWSRYVGAHYATTPASGLTRSWAGGGLREPGGGGTNYQIAASGGGYIDTGLTAFTTKAVPAISDLLANDRYAVVTIGGISGAGGTLFLDSMATTAGRDAFKKAIHDRVDAIAALKVAGWEKRIYFQFGNEITNNNSTGFYGVVCLWATRNEPTPVATCDTATQFAPAYVENYLAPGIAALEEKSQALFGRPNALNGMLGSIVNLTTHESFLTTLLSYRVVGTLAPAYANRLVHDLVDTVSIHYTAVTPNWKTALDNFVTQYLPGGVPTTRVRALWATEEGGANNAEQGFSMATAMRVVSRYLSWWQANKLTPDTAHVFFWGSDIKGPSGTTCSGCTSLDEDMPLLHNFVGDRALTQLTQSPSAFSSVGSVEGYEFSVTGADKRVLTGFVSATGASATLSGATLNLAAWAGRSVAVTGYQIAGQGLQALSVTPATVNASASTTISFSATLNDHDVVLIFLEAL